MIYNAMVPDFCEYDEYKNGVKREGTFAALSGWVQKMVTTLAFSLSGILLVMTGFDVELGSQQSVDTFFMMRVLVVVLPILFLITSFIILKSYPIDKNRTLEIRSILDHRYLDLEETTNIKK